MNTNKFTIGNVLEHLPTARKMHTNHGLVQKAKDLYYWAMDCHKVNWPHRPLVHKSELQKMLKDQEARQWLLRAKQVFGQRKQHRPMPKMPSKEAAVRVVLPSQLDTSDKQYEAIVSRLQYVRNVLIALPEDAPATKEVNLNGKLYQKDDLYQLTVLLRPWYNAEWDKASFVVEKRRLARLNKAAESVQD
jgi:hypothetical protein